MKTIAIIGLLLVLVVADQFVPISRDPYGFSFGSEDGHFHLEAFLDLLCKFYGIKVLTQGIHGIY